MAGARGWGSVSLDLVSYLLGKRAGAAPAANPNSLTRIAGTIAEPWGDCPFERLRSKLLAGDASAEITATVGDTTGTIPVTVLGTMLTASLAAYTRREGEWVIGNGARFIWSESGLEQAFVTMNGTTFDLQSAAGEIETLLTLRLHPMPEEEADPDDPGGEPDEPGDGQSFTVSYYDGAAGEAIGEEEVEEGGLPSSVPDAYDYWTADAAGEETVIPDVITVDSDVAYYGWHNEEEPDVPPEDPSFAASFYDGETGEYLGEEEIAEGGSPSSVPEGYDYWTTDAAGEDRTAMADLSTETLYADVSYYGWHDLDDEEG